MYFMKKNIAYKHLVKTSYNNGSDFLSLLNIALKYFRDLLFPILLLYMSKPAYANNVSIIDISDALLEKTFSETSIQFDEKTQQYEIL